MIEEGNETEFFLKDNIDNGKEWEEDEDDFDDEEGVEFNEEEF